MNPNMTIKAPFFEIGPKSYIYGQEVLDLAKAADEASEKYDIDIIFTTPLIEITHVKEVTNRIHVFAPHMDALYPGRGIADILPESLAAEGVEGVMLNHAEKTLSVSTLQKTIRRAEEVGISTMVCADSIAESKMVSLLHPDIIVAEPTELIGTGSRCDSEYAGLTIREIRQIDPNILILLGAGISNGQDVCNTILAGADAAGSSSGIINAPNRFAMIDEMISAVRKAWEIRLGR